MEFNTNACNLYTFIHNSLVTETSIERTPLMQKIVYLNEKLKSCKTILDDSDYNTIKNLLNLIEKGLLNKLDIIKLLNDLDETVTKVIEKLNFYNSSISIHSIQIQEIGSELLYNQQNILDKDDSELSKEEKVLNNVNLDSFNEITLNSLLNIVKSNYQINYIFNLVLISEMIIKNLYNLFNIYDSFKKDNLLFFLLLKYV